MTENVDPAERTNADPDEPPKACGRCGGATVAYECTCGLVSVCRVCALVRIARWLALEHAKRATAERVTKTCRVELRRVHYLVGSGHDEALAEAVALVEGGASPAEALDEVLRLVTRAELEAVLASIGNEGRDAA